MLSQTDKLERRIPWVDDPAEALRVLQERLAFEIDAESPAFAKSRTTRRSP